MGLKAYSNKQFPRISSSILWLVMLFLFSACAGVTPPPQPETGLPAPEIIAPPDSGGQMSGARAQASHSLIQEGYELLIINNFDGAIRLLERAVGINPADGPGYYYLAEAWMGKQDFEQASRFNDLAGLYLRGDSDWCQRAQWQKERIDQGMIDP